MKLNFANGGYWGIKYTLPQDSYVATMEVVQDKMEPYLPSNTATIEFDVAQNLFRTEEGRTFEERQSSIYYKFVGDSPDELESMSDDSESLNQDVKWVAFKSQFFSAVFVPKKSFNTANITSKVVKSNPDVLKIFTANTTMDYSIKDETPVVMDVYFGPNLYPLLSDIDEKITGEDGRT